MTHSSSLFPSWRRFFRYWARRKTLVRALKVAGLWGLALTVGLHGDVLLSGQVPASLFAKIIWTSVVLYGSPPIPLRALPWTGIGRRTLYLPRIPTRNSSKAGFLYSIH